MSQPLDSLTLGLLRCWADAQPNTAVVGISTLRAVLDAAVQLRREVRDAKAAENAAWDLLMADLTPDTDTPTDFPKDA